MLRGCFLEVATTSCSHTVVDMAKLGWKQNEASSSSCRICRPLCQWLLSSIDGPCSVYPDFRRQNDDICPSLPKLLRSSGSWGVCPMYLIFSQCVFPIVSYLRASLRLNTWISPISHEVAGRTKSLDREREKGTILRACIMTLARSDCSRKPQGTEGMLGRQKGTFSTQTAENVLVVGFRYF